MHPSAITAAKLPTTPKQRFQELLRAVCHAMQTSISLPFITATADGPKHIETNLSRAKFEEISSDLLDRCRVPVQQALKDANLSVSDLNEVILVGGSTRIPAVQVGSSHNMLRSLGHAPKVLGRWPICLTPQAVILITACRRRVCEQIADW